MTVQSLKMRSLLLILMINLASEGNILLWSPLEFSIPTMKHFNLEALDALTRELNVTKVFVFASNSDSFDWKTLKLPPEKYTTAFVLNGGEILNRANATRVLLNDTDALIDYTAKLNDTNHICVLYDERKRIKRENAETITFKGDGVLIEASNMSLNSAGRTCAIRDGKGSSNVERGDSYATLEATTSCDDEPITLRFKFVVRPTHWILTTVDAVVDGHDYTFRSYERIVADRNRSYYCPGPIAFVQRLYGKRLVVSGLRVQPDVENDRFGEADRCANVFTATTFSFLSLSVLMTFGVGISLYFMSRISITTRCGRVMTEPLYAHPESFE